MFVIVPFHVMCIGVGEEEDGEIYYMAKNEYIMHLSNSTTTNKIKEVNYCIAVMTRMISMKEAHSVRSGYLILPRRSTVTTSGRPL